jgi:hypothetical protein
VLSHDELVRELNTLLKKSKLDLPEFRKEVNKAGKNVSWLKKNIKKRNPNYNSRIDILIDLLIAL